MDLSDRIAVCLSGQIRTGVLTAPNILRYIGNLLPKVDFFIHTWDIETISPWALDGRDKEIANTPFDISLDKFNKMTEIYRPIKACVDNFEEYILYRRTMVKNYIYRSGLFHSAYESVKLKREYEKLNNSVYYKVLRLRPDMLFGKHGKLEYEIEFTTQKWTTKTENNENKLYVNDPWNGGPELIEDVCWLSSSPIMDTTCDVVYEFEDNDKLFTNPWQMQLKFFLDKNGIISRSFKNNDIRIYRDYMVGTDMDIS